MKQRKKRFFVVLLSCILACGMSACNSGNQEETEHVVQIDKEHVYKEKDLSDYMFKMGVTDIYNVIEKNGRLFVSGAYNSEKGEYTGDIYASINIDGSEAKTFSAQTADVNHKEESTGVEKESEEAGIDSAENEGETSSLEESVIYSAMAVNAENNFVLLKNRAVYNNQDYTNSNTYSLVVYSQDGALLAEEEIKPKTEEEKEDYYISSFTITDSNEIYLVESYNKLVKYNKELKREKTLEIEKLASVIDIFSKNGKLYVIGWDESYDKQYIWTLTEGESQFSDPVQIPGNGSVIRGENDEFYIVSDTDIRRWKIGETDSTLIMNYIDSNVSVSYINKAICADGKFYIAYSDIVNDKSVFSEFTKVNPEDVIEKQIISLGCYYLDYQMKKQIIQFNKKSEKYHIKVTDYSQYNTDDDNTVGLTKMNLDLTMGKAQDIIILNENMSLDNYIQKGILEDLKPLMERKGVDISQFVPNVIKAYSKDDKLYCLVPSFYIQTYVGKESIVGKTENWSVKDAKKLMESYAGKSELFERKTRLDILNEGMNYMGSNIIDVEKGICKFNTEEFKEFLEFANSFPKEVPEMDEEYWNNYESLYRDNRALLMDIYIGSIRDFNYLEKGRMGEKVCFVGFPNSEGEGALIIPSTQIAISKSSKLKDEAFDFVSYFISDEYQNSSELYNLPISLKALKKQMDDAQKKYTYTDENGQEVEYDEYYYCNGAEEIITPIEVSRANELLQYICSVEQRREIDSKVMEIITEEATAYFADAKTVEETINLIQNRVQIYINENR